MDQERRIRREIANSNERRRMQSINAGFQTLRNLLPHHDGDKLSKAATLQHTAQYVYQIEQEKSRLISQNNQLRRIIYQQQQQLQMHNLDAEGSGCLKRKWTEEGEYGQDVNPEDMGDTAVDRMKRELMELRVQLDQERHLRLSVEKQVRSLESQVYPDRMQALPMKYARNGRKDGTLIRFDLPTHPGALNPGGPQEIILASHPRDGRPPGRPIAIPPPRGCHEAPPPAMVYAGPPVTMANPQNPHMPVSLVGTMGPLGLQQDGSLDQVMPTHCLIQDPSSYTPRAPETAAGPAPMSFVAPPLPAVTVEIISSPEDNPYQRPGSSTENDCHRHHEDAKPLSPHLAPISNEQDRAPNSDVKNEVEEHSGPVLVAASGSDGCDDEDFLAKEASASSRHNLETIVEAIRQVEGERTFAEALNEGEVKMENTPTGLNNMRTNEEFIASDLRNI